MTEKLYKKFDKLQDVSLLMLRFILAYGFYEPAMSKIKNISSVAEWFANLGIPVPMLSAYLAAGTEIVGIALLILGFLTRIISIPLIITMIVAIITVHWNNGFAAGENGFEIPLYYIIMLLALMAFGSGKYSVDHILFKNKKAQQNQY